LNILQQMAPQPLPSPADAKDTPSADDMNTNISRTYEKKLDKSTSIEVCHASNKNDK
jgi:hypothetical protein